MKLQEIADRIDAHLKRFASDPKINIDRSPDKTGLHDYYFPGAYASGRYVGVWYRRYQHASNLTKDEALRYLHALDNGFVGRHYEALREFTP